MSLNKLLPIFLFFIFLQGCIGGSTGNVALPQIPSETTEGYSAYFCPRDNCYNIFFNYINSSKKSVYCAFYNLESKKIIDVLANKGKDVNVKLVLYKPNYDGKVKIDNLRLVEGPGLMHNKFCIIDGGTVITGSFNPTENNLDNNNLVVIHSNILSSNYEDEFNEMWNNVLGSGKNVNNPIVFVNNNKIENYFCPEDNCENEVVEELNSAKHSVHFMAYVFTSEKIADALLYGDLDVNGIVESRQSNAKSSQYNRLNDFGIGIIKDNSKYLMHHKVFIIDNETVITGSFNPTMSANTKNDENILIIHDSRISMAYLDEFNALYSQHS